MRSQIIFCAVLTALVSFAAAQPNDGESKKSDKPSGGSSKGTVERGKYLVHHVAMCTQCHTPRDDRGAMIEVELLAGAPIPLKSPYPGQAWAPQAPTIAGLPGGWSQADVARFLETGRSPSNEFARQPMPPFRMTRADAESVAAYLKSL